MIFVSLIVATVGVGWSAPAGGPLLHLSGLTVLGSTRMSQVPPSRALAQAWSDAQLLAQNSADLGYPWADSTTGQLVIGTTTPAGDALVQRWIAGGAQFHSQKTIDLPRPLIPVRTRSVEFSNRALETIKNDAIRLVQMGVPDADLIYKTEPDWENNRILITLSRQSDALLAALAGKYGTQAIAVRIEPRAPSMPGTRGADDSPFFGGARINATKGCTSAFSWTDSVVDYMLTAAHCASSGYFGVSTPVRAMGDIYSGSRENWTDGVGTVLFPNDPTYRGDSALIQLYSSVTNMPHIYNGVYPDASSYRVVREMWGTSPAYGDQYCTGGSTTYELCGWQVDSTAANYRYGNGEVAMNVTTGWKGSGNCADLGDSGGPVYTYRFDGAIAAKWIHSGGTGNIFPCHEVFTDIRLPFMYFPGWLKTG